MNIYDWITQTFLSINYNDINFVVVNDEIVDDDNVGFRRYEFSNFNYAVEWARRNRARYVIDDKHMLYIGSETGIIIYIKDVNKQ